jgi:solute carrier family 50 protein (sugar transporter)
MNTTNAFFWCVYAFTIEDYYILIPNGIGFIFGLVQVLLFCIFPREHVVVCSDGTEQFLSDERENAPENESEII